MFSKDSEDNSMGKFRIVAVGDFGTSTPETICIGENLNDLINQSDIRIINFEGCLHRGRLISATGRSIPQSDNSPKWCIENGFNIISLANNHTMDFGEDGLKATKAAFSSLKPSPIIIGAGNWDEVYSLVKISVRGKSIGFLGATSADFSALKCKWDDKNKIGCGWVNSPEFTLSVVKAKQQCDYLILIIHAGVEHLNHPLPEWRERYQELIDLGADAIIASHPHVPQGLEYHNGKPIYYSLGNFHFQGSPKPNNLPTRWDSSIAAVLDIDNQRIKADFFPVRSSNGKIEIDKSPESRQHIDRLSELLTDDSQYMRAVNKEIGKYGNKFMMWFLSGLNAIVVKRDIHSIAAFVRSLFKGKTKNKVAIHQLREESSRYAIIRAIKQSLPDNL